MFLKLFDMWKLPVVSSGSRNVWRFTSRWSLHNRIKPLSLRKKWLAGRGSNGRIILWTKAALLNRRCSTKINYNLRYNKLGFVASFQLVSFSNKLLTLVYFSSGSLTYYLSTEYHQIFSFSYLNRVKRIRKFFFKSTYFMLYQVKKLSFVSVVELSSVKGAQYIRSSGCKGKVIKLDKLTYSAVIQLPSGVKKIFSYFSFVNFGRVCLSESKKYYNTKAGYWRSFGVKPCVRGVAMNPVDHPHGGRTKSIKYPRTPWGKTTKYK